jgi:uncharacterized protein YoxC
MTVETTNAIVAAAAVIALLCVAVAALIAALALWRVARDVRGVTRSLDEVTTALRTELPPTLQELRAAAANANRLSAELPPRLERIDALLDEGDATLKSVRATADAAQEIVRGPSVAMDRAKGAARSVGSGLARGASRLVRGVGSRVGIGDDSADESAGATEGTDAEVASE